MNTRRLFALAFASALVALTGCPVTSETIDSGSASPDAFVPPGVDAGMATTTVSFATDVAPIISGSCGGGRCHNTLPYAFLMGSTRCSTAADRRYVVPGNADTSYVIAKLTGSGICGSAMPPTRRLSGAQIMTIRTWINEGALDN